MSRGAEWIYTPDTNNGREFVRQLPVLCMPRERELGDKRTNAGEGDGVGGWRAFPATIQIKALNASMILYFSIFLVNERKRRNYANFRPAVRQQCSQNRNNRNTRSRKPPHDRYAFHAEPIDFSFSSCGESRVRDLSYRIRD